MIFHLIFYLYTVYLSSGISFVLFQSFNPFLFCCVSSQIINVLWWYYFSKLIEFMDTFFFILRKNNHQITFLHIYHHASMLNIWWFVMNWIPCGHCECLRPTLPSSDSNHSSNHIYCLSGELNNSSALMLNPLALKTACFPHKALKDTEWHLLTWTLLHFFVFLSQKAAQHSMSEKFVNWKSLQIWCLLLT